MNKILSKSTKRKLKKVVKPLSEETERVKESAKQQITGKVEGKESVIVEAMQQTTDENKLSPDNKSKKDREMIKRAKDLEEQILIERNKRIERYKEWERGQEEEVVSEPGKPLEVPSSKPARGAPDKGMGKQKSPEVRKSKH